MSYVEKTLGPGETVLYRAAIHWMVFGARGILVVVVWFVFYRVFDVLSGPGNKDAAALLSCFAALVYLIPALLRALLLKLNTEMAITNRRLILKTGILSTNTLELNLGKVESVSVSQGPIGRIMDYGTVTISGTGSSSQEFRFISDPLEFRRVLHGQQGEPGNGGR